MQAPADPFTAFRDFVTNERQRISKRRQEMVRREMDKFSREFKVRGSDADIPKPYLN
jgi:hypothetical protein